MEYTQNVVVFRVLRMHQDWRELTWGGFTRPHLIQPVENNFCGLYKHAVQSSFMQSKSIAKDVLHQVTQQESVLGSLEFLFWQRGPPTLAMFRIWWDSGKSWIVRVVPIPTCVTVTEQSCHVLLLIFPCAERQKRNNRPITRNCISDYIGPGDSVTWAVTRNQQKWSSLCFGEHTKFVCVLVLSSKNPRREQNSSSQSANSGPKVQLNKSCSCLAFLQHVCRIVFPGL